MKINMTQKTITVRAKDKEKTQLEKKLTSINKGKLGEKKVSMSRFMVLSALRSTLTVEDFSKKCI